MAARGYHRLDGKGRGNGGLFYQADDTALLPAESTAGLLTAGVPIALRGGSAQSPPQPGGRAMKLLRLKDVIRATGLSRVTIWRLEKVGKFPARRQLGTNSVAWIEGDVDAWILSRPVVSPACRG